MSPKAARRATASRGLSRTTITLALLGFVAVAAIVVWRRSYGNAQSGVVTALDEERRQLEAERARLQRDIREASSRARLQPIVERLGLRVPADSMVVNLPRSPRGAR